MYGRPGGQPRRRLLHDEALPHLIGGRAHPAAGQQALGRGGSRRRDDRHGPPKPGVQRHLHHPRDRRSRPHQGLPVLTGGHYDDRAGHGRHQRRDQGPLSRRGPEIWHHLIPRGTRHPARH